MHYEDGMIMVIVIAFFWLIGLALCMGAPVIIVRLFHVKLNLWGVSLVGALVWAVVTYIWISRPI